MFSLRLARSSLASRVAQASSSSSSSSASGSIRFYSGPTTSEEAAKADKHHKHHDKEQMQKETLADHAEGRRADKHTASPNDAPTESEDVAHAHKSNKGPKELQEETAKKRQSLKGTRQ
ncbi:hypothetical protein BCV69DRAFT_284666 [Microstroma glucosiphilum]|uniref:Uncharacterized protein n=1 Tax=Pseudomicrostroma glucosiphilum TaxID=1684307 RepID=A0A316U1J5_9BASI|nr:hypothetical protein BCV69DRAFT_284666 [Pseudomicrostroma glucosiphilum]PWN19070.1 hypothetical protein BCV69DRAFT_284666 [Pseudomicrostroma glucosiphilum]